MQEDGAASRAEPIALHGDGAGHVRSAGGDYPVWLFYLGIVVNIVLRLMIFYFAAESALLPDDERFAGKGLTIRNILIAVVFTMLFPFHYFLRKKWPRYPVWMDVVYLSIFWLDMAGNSVNLFDLYEHFDALPHTWGPGALGVVFMWWQGWSALSAAGVATMIHTWLECEEFWGDMFFGTHNVRGAWDTVSDLGSGLVGVMVVIVASAYFAHRSHWRQERATPEPVPQEAEPIPFPTRRSARGQVTRARSLATRPPGTDRLPADGGECGWRGG